MGAGATADATVWASAIFDGTAAVETHNIGLGDGLFFGQGSKDTGSSTWGLHDVNGLIGDTGISSVSSSFLVVRIDFSSSGDESVWMWVDPDLDAEPTTASAIVSGTASSFEADFVRVQLESAGDASLDEIRIGDLFSEVATHPAPEPSTFLLVALGMGLLSARSRATHSVS